MKRILSFIMVVAMLFSVMPLQEVYAEEQTEVSREIGMTDCNEEESDLVQESTESEENASDAKEEETALEKHSTELEECVSDHKEEMTIESLSTEQNDEDEKGSDNTKETAADDEEENKADEDTAQDKEAEDALNSALKAVKDGKALRLTAEEWIAAGSSNPGDLVWTTASSDMAGKVSAAPVDVEGQSFNKAVKIKTTQKASNNWDAQVFFKVDGEIKENDTLFFAFRLRGIAGEGEDSQEVKANIRIRPDNNLTAAEKNIDVNKVLSNPSFPVGEEWTLYCGMADSPVANDGKFGSMVFQVGMAAEEFEIADLCVINMSRGADDSKEEPKDGEAELEKATAQYTAGKASMLTAEEWNEVGTKGDNCWVDCNTSMTAKDVTVTAEADADYGKALRIKTLKKAEGNYHVQLFFKMTGKVRTGDQLFYAFRVKGISNDTTPDEVVTNMRIRPSNGGDGSVNFSRNDIKDVIDEDWTLVWGYADAPANSADSDSMDAEGNKYGAFVLQAGMAQEEFLISDLQIYNLSRTPGEMDEPEEEVERFTFEEIMQKYEEGIGTLVTYADLADENAYELEIQEPLEDNGTDFVVEQISVNNQSFDKALHVKTTKTGDQAWDAQIYFNLDHTKEIKKGDTLLFGCKVRGISSVTNKEAMFVTANTRIRPDRGASSNFDITSSIDADHEDNWTQIYGGCSAAAASKADADGAWVFQLGSAVQELEIADVFVINFGNAFSEKQMPIMTKSYLGMEEDAQWRKDALERIERIRKQDVSVKLVDADGNPVENAAVKVEQTKHEFGFGTIVNVDDYNKWDSAKQQKFKAAFEQIAHNRAGFENALKHYYITNPDRQKLVDEWMDYFTDLGIDIRGHVLIYGSDDRLRTVDMNGVSTDMPDKSLLMSDTEEGRAALTAWCKEHIATYVEKYKGRIYNWDVVNENMTSHDWSDRLGGYDTLVEWFKDAHKVDPDAKLTYNDFGILSRDKGHQDYHYELCKYLVEHDAPMTTIGIQGHVSLISPIEVLNILDRFSELGKEIEITEFTYEDDDPKFQAQFTKDFMIAVFSEEAVTSITTWGFYQGCMYQPKAAMIDSNFKLKPNGEVWRDLIYNEWWTNETGKTNADGVYGTRGFKGIYEVTVQVGDVEQKFDLTLSDEKADLKFVYDGSAITKAPDVEDPDIHDHIYNETWKTDEENHWKECSECGEPGEQASHTYGEWIVEVEPSTTQAGSMYSECSVCGYRKTDTIAQLVPQGLWIAGIEEDEYSYTGSAIKPQIRVYDHGTLLQEKKDYTISYKNNLKANSGTDKKTAPTITVTGKGNYSGKETITFKILPIDLSSDSIAVDSITAEYNKKVQKVIPTVIYKGKKLANKKDFTVSYPALESGKAGAFQELGEYEILLTANENGNFSGTRTVKFAIAKGVLLSKASVAKIPDTDYTGSPIEPKPVVKMKGNTLTEGTDYEIRYENNIEVGTAAVVLKGINDYVGTKRISFKITGKPLGKAVVTGQTDGTYNGKAQFRNLTVSLNGTNLTEGTDYEVSYTNHKNAGTASVIIKGIHSYTGTVKKTFKIAAYDIGNDTDQMLGGLPENLHTKYMKGGSKPELSLTFNGMPLINGKDYSISYKNNTGITTSASIVIKGKGNFTGTIKKTFTIEGKALDDEQYPVTMRVSDIAFSEKAGKYISIPILTDADGTKLTAGKDYEKSIVYTLEDGTVLDRRSIVETGSRIKVTVTGTGAYTGSLETVYRITERDFSKAKITISAQSYTGEAVTLGKDDIVVKFGGTPLTYGDDYEIIEDSYKNNIHKGTAQVTIIGKGTYGGMQTIKFKIVSQQFVWLWSLLQ